MTTLTDPTLPKAKGGAKRAAAEARCAAMIEAAMAQLREVGVDRFNVNAVLRQAGGSKATLAKYFGDRSGLIAAAIRAEAEATIAALDLSPAPGRKVPLAQALARALGGLLHFYLRPDALALYRAVISAAPDNARSSAAFYHQGHRVIIAAVAALLAERQPDEVRADLDCADVADQLLHAIRAGHHERALIGLEGDVATTAIEARVARTLALMLPGITPAPD